MTSTKPTSAMTLSERIREIQETLALGGVSGATHSTIAAQLKDLLVDIELDGMYTETTETTTEYSAVLEADSDWLALPGGAAINMAKAVYISPGKTVATVRHGGESDAYYSFDGADRDAILAWLRNRIGGAA